MQCNVFHAVFQEGDKRQLRETSVHPSSSERYVHTFRDLSNFSGSINVTYRYLAGTPLNRKSKFSVCLKRHLHWVFSLSLGESYSGCEQELRRTKTYKSVTWVLKHCNKIQLLHRDLFTLKLNTTHPSVQVYHDLVLEVLPWEQSSNLMFNTQWTGKDSAITISGYF